jgi:hypothetical protein
VAASGERRTRLTRHEHELGEWTRARRRRIGADAAPLPEAWLAGVQCAGSRGNLWSFGTYDPYAAR